jgi:hypothetical protein
MKFGAALPTLLYSPERKRIAHLSYESLARTEVSECDMPLPMYVVAGDKVSGEAVFEHLLYQPGWILEPHVFHQPSEVSGLDPSLAWIVEKFFDETDCTHVIELADDMIYHPKWFIELKALVERHPDARAWSVYRSAHTRHHRTIRVDGEDHLVTSMAGNGTCWTREEWKSWGVHWKQGPTWPVPTGGDTLDLHHAYHRPGERWATNWSYMDHIGVTGIHCQPGVPEHAINFVGV